MSLKSAEVLRICLHIVWFQVAKTWITFKVFLFFNNEHVQHSQIGLFNSSARARLNENAKLDVKPTVSDPICVHKRTWELNSKGEEARKQIETWKNTKNNKTNHKRKQNKEPKQPENVTSSKNRCPIKKKTSLCATASKKMLLSQLKPCKHGWTRVHVQQRPRIQRYKKFLSNSVRHL